MEKLTHYQNLIKQILTEYEKISSQVIDPDTAHSICVRYTISEQDARTTFI